MFFNNLFQKAVERIVGKAADFLLGSSDEQQTSRSNEEKQADKANTQKNKNSSQWEKIAENLGEKLGDKAFDFLGDLTKSCIESISRKPMESFNTPNLNVQVKKTVFELFLEENYIAVVQSVLNIENKCTRILMLDEKPELFDNKYNGAICLAKRNGDEKSQTKLVAYWANDCGVWEPHDITKEHENFLKEIFVARKEILSTDKQFLESILKCSYTIGSNELTLLMNNQRKEVVEFLEILLASTCHIIQSLLEKIAVLMNNKAQKLTEEEFLKQLNSLLKEFHESFFVLLFSAINLEKTTSGMKKIGLRMVCHVGSTIAFLMGASQAETCIYFLKKLDGYLELDDLDTRYLIMALLIERYAFIGRYSEAEELFHKIDFNCIGSKECKRKIYAQIYAFFLYKKDYDSAITYMELAKDNDVSFSNLNEYKKNIESLRSLAEGKKKDMEELPLLEGRKNDVTSLKDLFYCYKALGKYEEALKVLDELIVIDRPNSYKYYYNKANVYEYNLKQYQKALSCYKSTLENLSSNGFPDKKSVEQAIETCEYLVKSKNDSSDPFLLRKTIKVLESLPKEYEIDKRWFMLEDLFKIYNESSNTVEVVVVDEESSSPPTKRFKIDEESNSSTKNYSYPWYTCDDLMNLINIEITNLGGLQGGNTYRLSKQFMDISDKQNYTVLVTPAVDTNGGIPIGFFMDTSTQQAPDEGRRDDRRDIFREVGDLLRNSQECAIKILFPYNMTQIHWLTGEIKVHKNGSDFIIALLAHDPYGGGKLTDANYYALCPILERQIKKLVANAKIQFQHLDSPYGQRQSRGDANACGAIVFSDISKRIRGQSLDIAEPYAVGAKVLRDKHIRMIKEHYPEKDNGRRIFLERHESGHNSKSSISTPKFKTKSEEMADAIQVTVMDNMLSDLENANLQSLNPNLASQQTKEKSEDKRQWAEILTQRGMFSPIGSRAFMRKAEKYCKEIQDFGDKDMIAMRDELSFLLQECRKNIASLTQKERNAVREKINEIERFKSEILEPQLQTSQEMGWIT